MVNLVRQGIRRSLAIHHGAPKSIWMLQLKPVGHFFVRNNIIRSYLNILKFHSIYHEALRLTWRSLTMIWSRTGLFFKWHGCLQTITQREMMQVGHWDRLGHRMVWSFGWTWSCCGPNMLWLWCWWCWWLRFRVTLCAPSVQNSKAVAKEEASTQWVMTALHMLKRMDLEDVLAVDSTGILRRIPTYRYCGPHCSHIIASIEHASMFAKFI